MKYKIGDKVCYKHKKDSDNVDVGEVGTIRGFSSNGNYAVNFETDNPRRHECGGRCNNFHGWWCSEDTLESAADGGFCTGFRGGKIPTPEKPVLIDVQPLKLVCNEEKAKEIAERLAKELNSTLGFSFTKKDEKNLKFTFYFNVNEGTRIDKSCNGTIPTITTSVVLGKFGDSDFRKRYSLKGEATCDKADYDMRQGVLEALANAVFDGNFEKAYDKAVKTNALCERLDRTCTYCGKVFDTVEEKQAEEAWHVERKKARRERYLLRKRAKEIAFEEQAQKMAKEMIKEDK